MMDKPEAVTDIQLSELDQYFKPEVCQDILKRQAGVRKGLKERGRELFGIVYTAKLPYPEPPFRFRLLEG